MHAGPTYAITQNSCIAVTHVVSAWTLLLYTCCYIAQLAVYIILCMQVFDGFAVTRLYNIDIEPCVVNHEVGI